MARIKTSTSKNSKSYSIIEDYNRNRKRTTKVIEKNNSKNENANSLNKQNKQDKLSYSYLIDEEMLY